MTECSELESEINLTPPLEERQWFRTFDEWRNFLASHPWATDPVAIESIAAYGLAHGVNLRLIGHIPPDRVVRAGPNLREHFLAAGFNPRQRAMLETFIEHPIAGDVYRVRIWAHEGLTPFALFLRGRFPLFVGTECADTEAGRAALFPIPVRDLMNVEWPDESFDIILSGDVLEHVPDLDASLCECARVMRPGGRMVATFPFNFASETTEIRAVLEADGVHHLAPPEYHDNPVDPDGGSLVFQVPGWDIVARCLKAGFKDASMQFWSSHAAGLTATDLAGVLLLDAWR